MSGNPILCDGLEAEYARVQARADSVAQALGESAPRWLDGETLPQYRKRLLAPLQKHSAEWRDVNLARADEDLLRLAESKIFADAQREASAPTSLRPGELVERVSVDRTGRRVSKFFGDPEVVWGVFKQPSRHVVGWNCKPQ